MPGLGSILSIAKGALAAQRYALDVTSHNIANVNTPGYSRQTSILEAERAEPYAGFLFGRGVKIEEIIRYSNNFIEARLRERKTDLMAMTEKETYMTVLEGIFNESSGLSLSAQFSDFWNAWQDLTNNPSGLPERIILYETGSLLAQRFMDLSTNLYQFDREINLSIEAGLEKIDQLTSNIATLNEQIISLEVTASANDLRDQRAVALSELSEYIDIKSFEHDDGNLTVITKGGCVLVDRDDVYKLRLDGDDINWEGSGGAWVNITDTINGGKMGGWLDMRDEIIPKYEADLDELVRSTIWEMNKIHTQGVGLSLFKSGSSVQGTFSTSTTLGDLGFGDGSVYVDYNGSLKIWIGDANGQNLQSVTIDLDYVNVAVSATDITETSTLQNLVDSINAQISAAGLSADLSADVYNDTIRLTSGANSTFGFSDDTSNILAALGINTFFKGEDAGNIEMNALIGSSKDFIAAAQIESQALTSVTGTEAATVPANAIGTAGSGLVRWNSIVDGTITIRVNWDGGTDDYNIVVDADVTSLNALANDINTNIDHLNATVVEEPPLSGSYFLQIDAESGYTFEFIEDTSKAISALGIATTGDMAVGDNTNALAIANLQYEEVTIKRWTYERGGTATSQDVNSTIEAYLHTLVGSIGIQSQGIKSAKEFSEVIVNQLTETRDNFSAVNLDEEMTNLIKYQHAYTAAAKLISSADEMLATLLEIR